MIPSSNLVMYVRPDIHLAPVPGQFLIGAMRIKLGYREKWRALDERNRFDIGIVSERLCASRNGKEEKGPRVGQSEVDADGGHNTSRSEVSGNRARWETDRR